VTAISFPEAAARSKIPIARVYDLVGMGYIKPVETSLGAMVDSDSLDTYLVNQKSGTIEENKEMIGVKKRTDDMPMKDYVSTPHGVKLDKIQQFGWGEINGKLGKPRNIPKEQLKVDYEHYQRPVSIPKVQEIQAHFDWTAFGRIGVAERQDKGLYIFDGSHRWTATLSRSDITTVPCEVYHFDSIEEEARAFINANINRKPVSILYKFNAGLVALDPDSLYIDRVLKQHNIRLVKGAKSPLSFSAVGFCYHMAKTSSTRFEQTMELVADICQEIPIPEMLVAGLFYLGSNLTVDLTDPRLRHRIQTIGATRLTKAAKEAQYFHNTGGSKIWAAGMVKLLNRGLRNLFTFKEGSD
jgi:hypothetical protein